MSYNPLMVKADIGLQTLRAYVKQCGTQARAAKRLKISQPYLSDILSGKRNLSDPVLLRIGLKRSIVKLEQGV